jgi:microcystin-dependent protein
MRGLGVLAGLLVVGVVGKAVADGIPTVTPLTYSGVLQNSAGAPVTTAQAMQLTLWDDASANAAANQKCVTPTQTITPDAQGRFQVLLDQACLDAVRNHPNLWVQLQVGAVVLPRSKLGVVPFSVESGRAVSLGEPAQQRLLPSGSIVAFGGSTAPPGWVLCDGAAYSSTDPRYAGLFAAIGTTYGTGTSAGQFNVPDLRGRSVLGAGTGTGLSPRTVGQAVGAEAVSLEAQNMPPNPFPGFAFVLWDGVGTAAAQWFPANVGVPTGGVHRVVSRFIGGNGVPVPTVSPSMVASYMIRL